MKDRILIVDDHKIFSESLKVVLERNNFEAICISDASVALKYLKTEVFDVVITDIEMPHMNGVTFIKEIKKNESSYIKVPKNIILTSHTSIKIFRQLINLNIDAYLSKNVSSIELISVVKKVLQNEKYFEKTIYEAYLKDSNINSKIEFTPRELDILKLILEEKTTMEIADELKISNFTVEGHRKNLMQKTNSKNVVGLIKYAILNNI
ncbi:Two-component system response regulatory protein, LuxR family [Flavobacterium indicum GPTSA100-9 = DSM 17447]|uniref:Two-component system response regulatory protein, LuxR family n=1 Tax=Flavobacterium indicum (strain DSM 17447 / CIP 109464 / GPTSA100-9) TaxID=1094466 RepID=H8XRW7_FLAIG|nr:response regulator transcription factor [Flavobacterium indicum]CCG54551.1 Two-component system response regulatory protein, LuxR family [Flavobacterium indicum GPTSA100-9 = DSM 17447]